MYSLIRPILFRIDPERAHGLACRALKISHSTGFTSLFFGRSGATPVQLMGLSFPNRVGLAAGFDKNADYLDALGALGFGFIEVGTVTPRPQPGNPKPRLFRITPAQALINRMGFNNAGAEHMRERLERRRWKGIVGVNIGKNFDTPAERAVDDYLHCFRLLAPVADYITINVSSPNTPGLRALQESEMLRPLLEAVVSARSELKIPRPVPILVKISPDLSAEQLGDVAAVIRRAGIEGVVATNTTLDRSSVQDHPAASEAGGLSGAPLLGASTRAVAALRAALGQQFPIIGVGGIMCEADARRLVDAGADAVQIYSGFVYRGPSLVRELVRAT